MINWSSLILVASVAIGASVGLVTVFSLGMRLMTNARNIQENTKKKEGVKPKQATAIALNVERDNAKGKRKMALEEAYGRFLGKRDAEK